MTDKFGYIAEIESDCTDYERDPEPFGDWSESWNNTFIGIRKSNKVTDYPSVISTKDFQPGDDVYVVWVEWDSGDSFGWAERAYKETLAIFDNQDDALALKKMLLDPKYSYFDISNRDDWKSANRFTYSSKDGQEIEIYYAPWVGYFERLADVNIKLATMGRAQ